MGRIMQRIREIFNRRKPQVQIEDEPRPKKIRVRVICPNGRVLAFFIDPTKRLVDLKQEVLLELYEETGEFSFNVSDVWHVSTQYRMLRTEPTGLEIDEMASLERLNVVEQETFILQKRRFLTQNLLVAKQIAPPTADEITNATKDIPISPNPLHPMDINEIFQQSDLQFDVRKVIISLAQASARVIGVGPHATKLIGILKRKLANKQSNQDDTLQCLIDMGFSKEKATYGLKVNNGVYAKTLEWLLQHESDEIPSDEDSIHQATDCPPGLSPENDIFENINALLEIVRSYSHREIPPSKETVMSLIEMGFEEKEILKALKKTCNNKAAACEYLCGHRTESLIELRDGLAKDSPILRAILELPKVQMSLDNPTMFLAFLGILENENSVRIHGSDNDTTSVITHILQKYHEEKHALGINQFYNHLR
ncbi:ubiquitin-associated domain-containing protein 1 isoform X2 [Episyrphus balteatus]|uniref:ubiquitin-associated domain-containing protein 1 isoform X2 n=1 Tax=Episyrphus balteatus TaxID=286459 RepID=UPI00248534E6|nr:ubiquitin-associated domain-containing protein 1 isoform X2 [Episyrphus balteatus]